MACYRRQRSAACRPNPTPRSPSPEQPALKPAGEGERGSGGEDMEVIVQRDYAQMSKVAAQIVAELLNTKPNAVLGMATGSTPLGLYQELVRLHKKEQLDFSRVTTFNLDEYVGLPVNHPQSYHYFMHEHFFRHVNIPPHNINIPSGTTSNYAAFCEWYE